MRTQRVKSALDLYSGKVPLLKTLLTLKLSSFSATSAFRVTWSEQHHLGQDTIIIIIIIIMIIIMIINNNNIFYCANLQRHVTEIH